MSGRTSVRRAAKAKAKASALKCDPVPPATGTPADCKCDLSDELRAVRDALDDFEAAHEDCKNGGGGPPFNADCKTRYTVDEYSVIAVRVAGARTQYLLAPPARCRGCERKVVVYGGRAGADAGTWTFLRAGTAQFTITLPEDADATEASRARLVVDAGNLSASYPFVYVTETETGVTTATLRVPVARNAVARIVLTTNASGEEVTIPVDTTLLLEFDQTTPVVVAAAAPKTPKAVRAKAAKAVRAPKAARAVAGAPCPCANQ